jgi:hypothetical protein
VSCIYFIKNVRKESAEKTLDRIERGELGLCILVWVPLMAGADRPEVIRRWRDLAMRQQRLDLRGSYGSLALVFAEMAGRKAIWQTGLEGFDMQESTIMRQWRKDGIEVGRKEGLEVGRQEGRQEGLQEGALANARAAVLNVLQARFLETPVPEGIRAALEGSADVGQLTDWLRAAALTTSPADFERLLTAAG